MSKNESKKTPKSKKIGQGWLTTDADEIQRRYQRALTEEMFVSYVLSSNGNKLNDYQVISANKHSYRVELRSKTERINSCDCPDYQMNGLGKNKLPIAIIQIEQILIAKTELDREIILLVETIRDECNLLTKELFDTTKNCIKQIEEILLKMSITS
jgi:hypothetical protein